MALGEFHIALLCRSCGCGPLNPKASWRHSCVRILNFTSGLHTLKFTPPNKLSHFHKPEPLGWRLCSPSACGSSEHTRHPQTPAHIWLRPLSEPSLRHPFTAQEKTPQLSYNSGQHFHAGYWMVAFCFFVCFYYNLTNSFCLCVAVTICSDNWDTSPNPVDSSTFPEKF